MNLKNLWNHKSKKIKKKRARTFENVSKLHRGGQKVLNGFESKIFPIIKQTEDKGHPLELFIYLFPLYL